MYQSRSICQRAGEKHSAISCNAKKVLQSSVVVYLGHRVGLTIFDIGMLFAL
jgi:hypothetical protein